MPRAGTKNAAAYNRRDEDKRKAAGWVRGPRIRAKASEALRELAYRHQLPPSEVVSRLILGELTVTPSPFPAGLSEAERVYFEREAATA